MRLIIAMFIFASLAGCSGQESVYVAPEPPAPDPAPAPDPGVDADNSTPPAPNPGPEQVPDDAPPVLAINLTVTEAEVPFATNLSIDVSDPDQDNVTWVAALNGTEIGNGTQSRILSLNITAVGNHTVRVTVASTKHTIEAETTIVGLAPPAKVEVEDSDADGDIDMLDITRLEMEVTDAGLEVVITLQDLTYPTERGLSPWWYSVFVDGLRYDSGLGFGPGEATNEDHSDVYDLKDDSFLGYEYTTWDADTDTVWILIPHAELEAEGLSAPYEVYVASMFFPANQTADTAERDVAPDGGPVAVG